MRYSTLFSVIFALLIQGCAKEQMVNKTEDKRPCVANLSSTGSFFSSRTFKTFHDFSGVSRSRAYSRIIPSLASGGWTISSSDKVTGVITSWAKPNYAKGETESLNVVIRNKGTGHIRVELTYIAPAMAFVPKGSLIDALCTIMDDVKN